MTIKYEPLCHDAERTMEDQIRLLGACAKRAWDCFQIVDPQNRGVGVGGGSVSGTTGPNYGMGGAGGAGSPSPEQELRWAMQALWNQLSETDIFMAGVHAGDSST